MWNNKWLARRWHAWWGAKEKRNDVEDTTGGLTWRACDKLDIIQDNHGQVSHKLSGWLPLLEQGNCGSWELTKQNDQTYKKFFCKVQLSLLQYNTKPLYTWSNGLHSVNTASICKNPSLQLHFMMYLVYNTEILRGFNNLLCLNELFCFCH